MRHTRVFTGLLGISFAAAACGASVPRFPLQGPIWVDPDTAPLSAKPEKYFSGLAADGADQIVFGNLVDVFAVRVKGEAWNVNALDEVPNSSWFTNRIGVHPMSPAEAARGACGETPPLDPGRGPWMIVSGKPDGANPGFMIKAPDGWKYLLKFDGPRQPERATMADVVGAKIFHAAGYNVPCNEVVYFDDAVLQIAPGAKKENMYGETAPLERKDVETMLSKVPRRADGRLRASSSRFLPGVPLGPFRYEGTRSDDPNDVIPHQHRRELRGMRLLAAWLNHFDSREQNTLDVWVETNGRGFLRHNLVDWGDCFGSYWSDPIARRMGPSGYFYFDHVFSDIVTLGLLPRPWFQAELGPEAKTFGYYGSDLFVASKWRPGYDNPAFQGMTHRDALWATRIIARFTDAHVRAIAESGELESPSAEDYFIRVLQERRDIILGEYLARGSPLDRFLLVRPAPGTSAQTLCFEDLALRTGVTDVASTTYRVRYHGGAKLERELGRASFRPDPARPHRSCIDLPLGSVRAHDLAGAGARPDDPLRYAVVEIANGRAPDTKKSPAVRLYFYDLGPEKGHHLVGVDRLADGGGPLAL